MKPLPGGPLRRLRESQISREAGARLDALFDNRLKVLDSLLGAGSTSSLPLEHVLKVILDCAVEAAGAESGTIDFFERQDGDLAVAQTVSTDPGGPGVRGSQASFEVPLSLENQVLGLLTLNLRGPAQEPDRTTLFALERFSGKAAKILENASMVDREKASAAYIEASNLVKSRFLTTISHELRTPLTSIIGYSKTLDNHWDRLDNDQKREFVREIEKQGSKMHRLVERILEAARVELQGVVIQPVAHDVRTSVQESLAPFMAADASRLEVALPDRPIEGEIDPFVIDQVLSNLVDNALRYTTSNVRVSLDCYRSSVIFSVTDHGDGIDPKQMNMVLEPLYRIDENVQSGTGLGLHIVRTLIESHGGRGEIRSGATGTSIVIKLPRTASRRISGATPTLLG